MSQTTEATKLPLALTSKPTPNDNTLGLCRGMIPGLIPFCFVGTQEALKLQCSQCNQQTLNELLKDS